MEGLGNIRKIFFIGIGGIGMSALAVILKARGYKVSGSDRAESSVTQNLIKQGIDVKIGQKAENISDDIDAVVYTNAISNDNPELAKARKMGIPVFERAAMLNILARDKFAIGVSGTHGKTTTTSMVAKIFLNAGLDPTLAVGGYLAEINGSGHEGKGDFFVYEACEAYGSFLKLHPNIAVITNIDADHLDYYGNIESIIKAFEKYIKENIPPDGFIIYNKDDANLRDVIKRVKPTNAISIGINSRADFTASKIQLDEFSSSFVVKNKGIEVGNFYVNIPGLHNVYNALLAIATALINRISTEIVLATLANFKNADRRFQLKYFAPDLMVIDDYAHHPAEIDATLSAAKNLSLKKNAQLIAVFQPHLYSRTRYLYKEFARSLSLADRIVLTEIYAAREKNTDNVSSKMIYDEIVKIKGRENVIMTEKLSDIPDKVKALLNGRSISIVITLGAGDVWKVSDMFGHC